MRNINDKGFSLVELIVVVAIMAVLVGVMAPQYVKYLERTRCVSDCELISTVLNACETMGLDPDTAWGIGTADAITIVIGSSGTSYTGGASGELNDYVPSSNVNLKFQHWGPFSISATLGSDGRVTFDISDDSQISELQKYSSDLANRLE